MYLNKQIYTLDKRREDERRERPFDCVKEWDTRSSERSIYYCMADYWRAICQVLCLFSCLWGRGFESHHRLFFIFSLVYIINNH